ncbi:MAG: MarR family winged helix-turn-helix transcriptional regulator [Actinomycetota bacterium]
MTRWLTDDQQASWRAWIAASLLLPERLNRDLQERTGLSLPDYEILVHLSEAPDRRLRMSDLAAATMSSRSRLSHQIDRLAAEGLVERERCLDDRRGAFAVLTTRGWETLVATAPTHVESVREHLVDVLSPEEFAELGRLCRVIADRACVGQPGDD